MVRIHAGFALADMGPGAQPAVPTLLDLLNGEDMHDRRLAAWTLGSIGPRAFAALPTLHYALHDPDPVVARFAGAALEKVAATARAKAA
jgi:HEAT repeat protein